jgi:excisionase family DNA binding protein
MDKEMAAAYLDVSKRTLQRYTTQGKIAVTYKHGKTGAEADYDQAELERFKNQKESEVYQPAVHLAPRDEGQSQALAPIDRESLALVGASAAAAIFERLQPTNAKPSIPIESKPLLKLVEACQLTGLSRQILREVIQTKKLRAKIIGKAWRIRREDIDLFLKKL